MDQLQLKDAPEQAAEAPGSIGLMLELAPGVATTQVSYEISGNGRAPIVGSIPVTDSASAVAAEIGGLSEGSGYFIALAATSADGVTECAGQGEFSITAGRATATSIELQCAGPGNDGGIILDPSLNVCPALSASAAPLRSALGGTIELQVLARDPNTQDALEYSWEISGITGGSIDQPGAADAVFSCTDLGQVTLTARVSDGQCERSKSFVVICADPLCGNGTLDGSETCDDGNVLDQDLCPADCRVLCGDGEVEGSESCEPSLLPSCREDCSLPSCGDGRLDPGETCDDGNQSASDACDARCQPPVCGDGVVAGTEECDDGNALDTDTCSSICAVINACPALPEISATPLSVDVGDSIQVSASTSDANGDQLTYVWGATAGPFSDPTSPSTSYLCAALGTQTLSVVVTDSHDCSRSRTQNVNCR